MKTLTLAILVFIATTVVAQSGPSLQDTTRWIHDIVEGKGTVVDSQRVTTFSVTFTGCHSSLTINDTWDNPSLHNSYRETFYLGDVDPHSIAVFEGDT
jgi:hypothetical protein